MNDKVEKKPSIFGMIGNPVLQFKRMKNHITIAKVLFIILFLSGVAGAIQMLAHEKTAEGMQKTGKLAEISGAGVPLMGVLGVGFVVALITALFGYLFTAFLYKVFLVFTESYATYKTVLCITLYVSVITLLGRVCNAILAIGLGGNGKEAYTSLAGLFEKGTMLYAVGSKFELFSIWALFVTALGLQIVAGISKKQSMIIIAVFFSLSVLFGAIRYM
ncbi:YIP1 family protein [Bacillus mycoides]|uniref:YIP1 family protein n=1 Tax=Bacillus mycoides TaxID=1405 RepID=UPI003F7508EC